MKSFFGVSRKQKPREWKEAGDFFKKEKADRET